CKIKLIQPQKSKLLTIRSKPWLRILSANWDGCLAHLNWRICSKPFVRTKWILIWFGKPCVKRFSMVKPTGDTLRLFCVIGAVRALPLCVKLRKIARSVKVAKPTKYSYQMTFCQQWIYGVTHEIR